MNFRSVMTCFASLIALASVLVACSFPAEEVERPQIKINVVMGNPLQLVEGTVTQREVPSNFFRNGFIDTLFSRGVPASFYVIRKFKFFQNDFYITNKPVDLMSENAAREKITHVSATKYRFDVKFEDKNRLSISWPAEKTRYNFIRTDTGNFTLKTIEENKQSYPAELLHFSVTQDQRFFSLLVTYDDPIRGKTVEALYFSNGVNATHPQYVSDKYYYLLGRGAVYRWRTPTITLSLGGRDVSSLEKDISVAINKWNSALNGRVTIRTEQPKVLYPFTDFRQQSVSIIDGYQADPHPRIFNFGATANTADDEAHTFVDADIFIFRKEFEKRRVDMNHPAQAMDRAVTYAHEVGHLLGLAHQFKGAQSIMSYSCLSADLQPYDIEAIQTLYK